MLGPTKQYKSERWEARSITSPSGLIASMPISLEEKISQEKSSKSAKNIHLSKKNGCPFLICPQNDREPKPSWSPTRYCSLEDPILCKLSLQLICNFCFTQIRYGELNILELQTIPPHSSLSQRNPPSGDSLSGGLHLQLQLSPLKILLSSHASAHSWPQWVIGWGLENIRQFFNHKVGLRDLTKR